MATAKPTIPTVSSPEAQKAAENYNQIISYRDGTSFGQPAPPPPKPTAAKSLVHGATKLAQDQTGWNTMCNLVGWKGTGGKTVKSKKPTRKVRKTLRKRKRKYSKRGTKKTTGKTRRGAAAPRRKAKKN